MPAIFTALLLVILASACNQDKAASATVDARPGEDAEICEGVAGGSVCNLSEVSDFPAECCAASEKCCTVGFETEGCIAEAQPCPIQCRYGSPFDYCNGGSRCLYSSPDGTDSSCSTFQETECTSDCPADKICGADSCCGADSECIDDCCVALAR